MFYPTKIITITGFASTDLESLCGAFTYSASYSNDNAIDASVFTFTNQATPILTIFTNDRTKKGSYTIKVTG